MGRPQEDSSSYQTDQPQEFDLQPQEPTLDQSTYNQEDYYDSTQQYQFMNTSANDPQGQQQEATFQQQQTPPQAYQQGCGAPQISQNNQAYPNGLYEPAPYPPQGPQTISSQAQPAPYPPQGPQTNFTYTSGEPNKPVAYPPQSPQQFPVQHQPPSGTYPPQPQAVPFPPKNPAQGYSNIPQFPPNPAEGIPVPVNQQAVVYNQNWQSELFDCMDDPTNALMTACVPCVTFGQIAEIIDNGQTSCATNGMIYGMIAFFIAMPCIMSCSYRTKLRARYGLVEAPAPDWLTHCLFEWCALCQEYRELQRRGLDPAIGWKENVARQNMQQPQVGMVPPMNQRMMA